MDYTSELNYKMAKMLGVQLRAFTDQNISPLGAWLDFDGPETKRIIQEAIKAHTLLKMTTWDKGLIYEGSHDGWHFEYKIPATEAYSAKPEVLLDGDVDRWLVAYFFITPEPVPDYCGSWLDCLRGWMQYKQKVGVLQPRLCLINEHGKWRATIEAAHEPIASSAEDANMCMALVNSLLQFEIVRGKEMAGRTEGLTYDMCPHCRSRFNFVGYPMRPGATCVYCFGILP